MKGFFCSKSRVAAFSVLGGRVSVVGVCSAFSQHFKAEVAAVGPTKETVRVAMLFWAPEAEGHQSIPRRQPCLQTCPNMQT